MAVIVNTADLPQLLNRLEEFLPLSLKVYGELKANLSGKWPGFDFFVDQWPDFNVVISKADPTKTKSTYVNNVCSVYSKDETALKTILNQPGFMNRSKRVVFGAVVQTLCDVIKEVVGENGSTVSDDVADWLQADSGSLKVVPVPSGMTVRPLDPSPETVATLTRNWLYGSCGAGSYIKALIESFPSVCLYDQDNTMIGYACGQPFGTLGMLFVRPEFRKRGYGKAIMSQLADIYVKNGDTPSVCITQDNPVSRKFHENLGFKLIPGMVVSWLTVVPKGQKCEGNICCV